MGKISDIQQTVFGIIDEAFNEMYKIAIVR